MSIYLSKSRAVGTWVQGLQLPPHILADTLFQRGYALCINPISISRVKLQLASAPPGIFRPSYGPDVRGLSDPMIEV